jgi:hypothetical protein
MRAVDIEIPLCALAREWVDGAVRNEHLLALRSAEETTRGICAALRGVTEVNVLYDRVAHHEQMQSIKVMGIFRHWIRLLASLVVDFQMILLNLARKGQSDVLSTCLVRIVELISSSPTTL